MPAWYSGAPGGATDEKRLWEHLDALDAANPVLYVANIASYAATSLRRLLSVLEERSC